MSAPTTVTRRGTAPPMHSAFQARRREIRRAGAVRRDRYFRAGALVVAVTAGLLAASTSPLVAVGDVAVVGVDGRRAKDVADRAGVDAGDSLVLLDLDGVAGRVRTLPWVRDVTVGRRLPSTVEVTVEVRDPLLGAATATGVWTVDGDGVVTGGGGRDLPELVLRDGVVPPPGERLADRGAQAAVVLHSALSPDLRAVVVDHRPRGPRDARATLRPWGADGSTVEVRFGDATAATEKARALGLVLARLDDWSGGGLLVDVRAPSNPVVRPQ